MRLKLVACDVFLREVCYYAAASPHILDIDFTSLGSHADSSLLRRQIQEKIDAADGIGVIYDAVLLCYGLCGNAAAGLVARKAPLVIPRAHDCCTILLGSRAAFKKHFGKNPNRPFCSPGYLERSEDYFKDAEQVFCDGRLMCMEECTAVYGEENARYIFEQLGSGGTPRAESLAYIEMPFLNNARYAGLAKKAAAKKQIPLDILPGNGRIIRNLLYGKWNENDFCVVRPGEIIEGVYDLDLVVRNVGSQ